MTSPDDVTRWSSFNYLELQLLIDSMVTRDAVLKEMIIEAKKELSSRSFDSGEAVLKEKGNT